MSAAQEHARCLFKQRQPTAIPVCSGALPRSSWLLSLVKGRKEEDVPVGETMEESVGDTLLTTAGCLQEAMAFPSLPSPFGGEHDGF